MRKTPFSFFSPREECLEVDTQGYPGTNALNVRKGKLCFHAASSPSTISTDIPPLKLQRPAATHSPGTDTAGVSGIWSLQWQPWEGVPQIGQWLLFWKTMGLQIGHSAIIISSPARQGWPVKRCLTTFSTWHISPCFKHPVFNEILNMTYQPSL